MSEINNQPVGLPPPFPNDGRLLLKREQVINNARLLNAEEREYHQQLCIAAGRRVMPPCCKSVHISLFFDGTNNNEKRNTEIDTTPSQQYCANVPCYIRKYSDKFLSLLHARRGHAVS